MNTPIIAKHHDPRTGKNYALRVGSGEVAILAHQRMAEMAEHDYQKSLPPEKRAVANQPTDFKCPYCNTNKEPTSRKIAITVGFLFVRTYLEDIFLCQNCHREFREAELVRVQDEVRDNNWRAECLERYMDGEITDEVFISRTSASPSEAGKKEQDTKG